MKVAVVGSIRKNAKSKRKKTYKAVCRQINRVLVERDDTLLVAHSDRLTAEAEILSYGEIKTEGVKKTNFWATNHIDAVKRAHAVIVVGGAEGSTVAGLFAISENKPFFPIALAGGAGQQFCNRVKLSEEAEKILDRINNDIEPLAKGWTAKFRRRLTECLALVPTIVVIHGRSPDRHDLVELLRENNIRAITLDTASGGGTIAELWDRHAKNADGAIAVATPDDIGASGVHEFGKPVSVLEMRASPRARENVWVEVGWAWGRLSRDKLRVLIPSTVRRDIVPTDLSGLRTIRYRDKPRNSRDQILAFCRELTK